MGTKNNPGDFDCYAAADPDEPMFVLLARDPIAPLLVRIWCMLRDAQQPTNSAMKIYEAMNCAQRMEEWRSDALREGKVK